MGLFGKKKEDKSAQGKSVQKTGQNTEQELAEKQTGEEQGQNERKVYIQGAGGTIVTKSILDGTSKLKWLFRQEGGHGNGWVAFGDRDSQEYVDDANNMAIVDFNTLADSGECVLHAHGKRPGIPLRQNGEIFRGHKDGEGNPGAGEASGSDRLREEPEIPEPGYLPARFFPEPVYGKPQN